MKIELLQTLINRNPLRNKNLIRIVLITSCVLFACTDEKLPKLTEYVFPKIFPPDSSLSYQVKDTVVKDTLFVEISLTNESVKSVYIPLNNWYIYGWPNKGTYNAFTCFYSFPEYFKTYCCNLLLFCSGSEWDQPNKTYYFPILHSFPIIKKLAPGDTMYFLVNIQDSLFIRHNINNIKIRGNILYSLMEEHKKVMNYFNIDEKKILREYDTVRFTFNFNEDPLVGYDSIDFGKPFTQYTDSSGINVYRLYPEIKENSYYENLLLFRKLFMYYRESGYDMGYALLDIYNHQVEEYNTQPEKRQENGNGIFWFRHLLTQIIRDTYHYSIIFKE